MTLVVLTILEESNRRVSKKTKQISGSHRSLVRIGNIHKTVWFLSLQRLITQNTSNVSLIRDCHIELRLKKLRLRLSCADSLRSV